MLNDPQMYISTTYKISEEEEREALMEIYRAMDGDNWTNKTNWGSDKPVKEWYGVYTDYYNEADKKIDYVSYIDLDCNNLKGELPAEAFSKLKNLSRLEIDGNSISGKIPENLTKLSKLYLRFNNSAIDGPLPEHPWSELMSYAHVNSSLRFGDITNDWRVPQWAENHDRFPDFWLNFAAMPKGNVGKDYYSYWESKKIPMSQFRIVDFDGGVHSNADFAKNKLTVLYEWESWCPMAKAFNQKLVPAYNQLHSKGFEVLGISTLCPHAIPCVNEEEYFKYIEDAKIPWKNCSYHVQHNWIEATYMFGGSPSIYAVDSNGDIVFQSFTRNYSDFIPFLEEYFGEKIEGMDYYTSSDYSKDGEVEILQQATNGKGIDLVFMGDGFIDMDMKSDGKYMKKMRKAMEQFFTVEPYRSLRDRFTVKAVKVVSPNEVYAPDAKHAIDEKDEVAFKYAEKAIGNDADKAMVIVVYNATASVGRSHTKMYEDGGSFVAYCMDGVSTTLNHEAGGHGFAHLADEYVEQGNEGLAIPEEKKAELDSRHNNGWYINADYHKGEENLWADYVSDPRYTSESIGYYEGSYLYGFGCYRPTENSMMRFNDCEFNAPSREAIYKRVMTLSEPDYKHSHQEFVAFDIATQKNAARRKAKGASLGNVNYTIRAAIQDPTNFSPKRFLPAPPVIIKGSWNGK